MPICAQLPASRPLRALRPSAATVWLCIAGLILPNALAAVAEILDIGLPPRGLAICLYTLLALAAGRLPRFALVAGYLAILVLDVATAIATAFYLTEADILGALRLGRGPDLSASPLMVALVAGIVLFAAANIAVLVAKRAAFARANRVALAALALVGLVADTWANTSPHYDFGPLAGVGQPFESAVQQSGFDRLVDAQPRTGRHVLLVVVESLGVLRDPAQRALLFAPFRDPNLTERYTVTTGETTFFGGTAYGEMRELCRTREPYTDLLDGDDPVCLPDLFRNQGYRTVSVHGYSDTIYDRTHWYPKVGFVRSVFQENLTRSYPRRCGGPFVGPCDVDLAAAIGDRLGAASREEPRQPLFLYWLTLNTHVPVRRGDGTPRYGCPESGGPFGDAEVCAMAELWTDLFEAVGRIALDHGPVEILLVGDHAPPLWRRSSRTMFEDGRVPWIRLSPRSGRPLPRGVEARSDRTGAVPDGWPAELRTGLQ